MKPLLIVDDNDKYARLIDEHFTALGYSCDRAITAKEGLEMFSGHPLDHYHVIVTDVTMESQLAGIWMLRQMHKKEYSGTVAIASTGFDHFGGIPITRLFMRRYGVDYLIPKKPMIEEKIFEFYPIRFGTRPMNDFREIDSE